MKRLFFSLSFLLFFYCRSTKLLRLVSGNLPAMFWVFANLILKQHVKIFQNLLVPTAHFLRGHPVPAMSCHLVGIKHLNLYIADFMEFWKPVFNQYCQFVSMPAGDLRFKACYDIRIDACYYSIPCISNNLSRICSQLLRVFFIYTLFKQDFTAVQESGL